VAIQTRVFDVEANNEQGTSTGLNFKRGSHFNVVATGQVKWDPGREWVGPSGSNFTDGNSTWPPAPVGALLLRSGQQFAVVGGGLLNFSPLTPDEIVFLMNDGRGGYWNNSGSFSVTIEYDDGMLI
jgi:hypothetical protein